MQIEESETPAARIAARNQDVQRNEMESLFTRAAPELKDTSEQERPA